MIPWGLCVYVEPFGGTFEVSKHVDAKVKVYNDINVYDIPLVADFIHHVDYKEIFKVYDGSDTFWKCQL